MTLLSLLMSLWEIQINNDTYIVEDVSHIEINLQQKRIQFYKESIIIDEIFMDSFEQQ